MTLSILSTPISIATNLAEGNVRFTKAGRKNFFVIARGSVQECVPLLEVASRRSLLDDPKKDTLRQELEAIAKMISRKKVSLTELKNLQIGFDLSVDFASFISINNSHLSTAVCRWENASEISLL